MRFLIKHCDGFDRRDLGALRFYLCGEIEQAYGLLSRHIAGEHVLQPLDGVKQNRAVYSFPDCRVVVKFNRLRHWRLRLQRHFDLPGSSGRYCLANEFINLRRLAASGLVPKLHGYGCNANGLLREEYLLMEYLHDAVTVDCYLGLYPEQAATMARQVFGLFMRMLDAGFVHLDPHPKNILVETGGSLKLIDLECCVFDVSERSFILAFVLGYFFHFWFHKFIVEQQYDSLVLSLITELDEPPGEEFPAVYQRFKEQKVSRKQRFRCLTSKRYRAKFLEDCLLHFRESAVGRAISAEPEKPIAPKESCA